MAKAKTKFVKIEVELVLTEHEARYLKDMLQNPVDINEPREQGEMRSAIWHALDGALKDA